MWKTEKWEDERKRKEIKKKNWNRKAKMKIER